jgi:hypothetical protein
VGFNQTIKFKKLKKVYEEIIYILFIGFIGMKSFGQTTIARWNFEAVTTSNTGTTPTITTGSAIADSGALVAGSAFSALHASASSAWSNPAGNGSNKSVSSNNWGVGDYYQFAVSTTGYSGISIKFDQLSSSTGPANFKVQYSTNGTTYKDFINNTLTIPAGNSWSPTTAITATTFTFNLSDSLDLNNKSTIYFRTVTTNNVSVNGGTIATTGTGRIDNFNVFAETVLPVTLKTLSASLINNQPQINWATSNETNFDYFGVEKSFDAKNFAEIAKVASAKASNGSAYQFSDVNKTLPNQFYRLRLVDNDGTFKYSSVVAVNGKASISLALYPNPVTNTIILSHPKAIAGAAIKVTGIDGRLLSTQNVQTGATQTSIDAARLVKGNYVVSFVNDGIATTTQLVKQ